MPACRAGGHLPADPGPGLGGHLGECPDLLRDHVDHLALALEVPVHQQQGVPPDHAPQPRPGVRPERDVDHPGLVLEREEDRALGRHRVLAGDDEATDPDAARPAFREGRIGHRTEPVQRRPEQRHDLPSRVQPDDRVGIAKPLRLGDRGECRGLGGREPQVHRSPGSGALLPGRPPEPAQRLAVHATA